jgi:hypothetical protein
MPKILQEMIASIVSSEPRFRIVGKLGAESDLLSAIRQIGPEVVITRETPKQDGGDGDPAASAHCLVNVLAINETGREAALYSLTLQRTPLGEISASGLISAIDRAAGNL